MAKKNFESALARLEQITAELEDGEQGLETSLKKFNEGIELGKIYGGESSGQFINGILDAVRKHELGEEGKEGQ